jgi:hypothetical protein
VITFTHFSTQNLSCTGNHQGSELCSQSFARLIDFLVDLAPRSRENTVALSACSRLGFLDDFCLASFCSAYDFLRLSLGFFKSLCGVLFCPRLLTLTFIRRGKAISDPGFAFVQCCNDRRPNKLHAEPDEDRKCNSLPDQRQVDVHNLFPSEKAKLLTAHYGEHDVERDGHTDNRDSIHQAHNDEELGPEHRQQLWLSGDALQESCAEHAHTHTDAHTG